MIGYLHFAVLADELYVLAPSMPDWVNGLYFLTLAEIQEARSQPDIPSPKVQAAPNEDVVP